MRFGRALLSSSSRSLLGWSGYHNLHNYAHCCDVTNDLWIIDKLMVIITTGRSPENRSFGVLGGNNFVIHSALKWRLVIHFSSISQRENYSPWNRRSLSNSKEMTVYEVMLGIERREVNRILGLDYSQKNKSLAIIKSTQGIIWKSSFNRNKRYLEI